MNTSVSTLGSWSCVSLVALLMELMKEGGHGDARYARVKRIYPELSAVRLELALGGVGRA